MRGGHKSTHPHTNTVPPLSLPLFEPRAGRSESHAWGIEPRTLSLLEHAPPQWESSPSLNSGVLSIVFVVETPHPTLPSVRCISWSSVAVVCAVVWAPTIVREQGIEPHIVRTFGGSRVIAWQRLRVTHSYGFLNWGRVMESYLHHWCSGPMGPSPHVLLTLP